MRCRRDREPTAIDEYPKCRRSRWLGGFNISSPEFGEIDLRSLGASIQDLQILLNALSRRLKSHRDFEAVQAIIGAVLQIHGEIFVENSELREGLESLSQIQKSEGRRMLDLVQASMGALSFVRDVL